MASTLNEQFIGSGITFPFEINSEGRVDTVTGVDLIIASITQILSFPRNFKFFNEKFGSRLEELLEEPSDVITITLLKTFVTEAITTYESRVKVISINIESDSQDNSKYNVEIVFKIRNSKIIDSFIYPFYKTIIY